MKTVYFLTLTDEQHVQISSAAQTAEAIAQGFMHGPVFIPSWAICDTGEQAAELLLRTVLEVGDDIDSVG